jgi:hypothetical protein
MTLSNWRKTAGHADAFSSIDRAIRTAFLISEKPTAIMVYRDGTAQSEAQTVRLEAVGTPAALAQMRETGMQSTDADALIVGYKSHPAIDDTDLQMGDRFQNGDQWYTVIQIFPAIPDRLLALARVADYGL